MSTQRLTREQAAIISAFTGILCGPFQDMHEYVERILERPVWTHQMAQSEIVEEIKEKSRDDFIAICAKEDPP